MNRHPVVTRTELAPLTGSRWSWIRDGALMGGLTGWITPAIAVFGAAWHPAWLVCGAVGALVGAGLAAVAPSLLAWLRPRVTVSAIVVGAPIAGFVLGGPLGAGLVVGLGGAVHGALLGGPVLEGALLGAMTMGVQFALCFLPYLVLSVVGRARWPVLVGSVLSASALGFMARGVLTIGTAGSVLLLGPACLIAMAFLAARSRSPEAPPSRAISST